MTRRSSTFARVGRRGELLGAGGRGLLPEMVWGAGEDMIMERRLENALFDKKVN